MRYSHMATHHESLTAEAAELDAKKRLGVRQKARRATIADELSQTTQPPATPRRAPTGERADFQGNVYAMHTGKPMSLREARRSKRTARDGIKFMRSRIQRLRRKRRTGGVK
jgi:hypothetical protein